MLRALHLCKKKWVVLHSPVFGYLPIEGERLCEQGYLEKKAFSLGSRLQKARVHDGPGREPGGSQASMVPEQQLRREPHVTPKQDREN